MPYAIIAEWDSQKRVSRYNYVDTKDEAIALVDKLRGLGPDALPPAKRAPNAYYVLMPPAPPGTGLFQHRARFWVADPVNGTVSFDVTACHAWQSKITNRNIDAAADKRVDNAISPDNPARAERIKSEMPDGAEKATLLSRIATIRTASQSLKDSLLTMTPEDILSMRVDGDAHWPS